MGRIGGRIGGRRIGGAHRITRRIGGRRTGGIRRSMGRAGRRGVRILSRVRPIRRTGLHLTRHRERLRLHQLRIRTHGVYRSRFASMWGGTRSRRRIGWGQDSGMVFLVGNFGRRRRYGVGGTMYSAGQPTYDEKKSTVDPEEYSCFVTVFFSDTATAIKIEEIKPTVKLTQKANVNASGMSMDHKMMYDVPCPTGMFPGSSFQANVGGTLMQINVPLRIGQPGIPVPAGTPIRVWGPGPVPTTASPQPASAPPVYGSDPSGWMSPKSPQLPPSQTSGVGPPAYSGAPGLSPDGKTQAMEVEIPPGMQGGMELQFETMDGRLMEVAIPEGLVGGQTFQVEVPRNLPPPPEDPDIAVSGQVIGGSKALKVLDNELGSDLNGIRITVPQATTVKDLLAALEAAQLVQLTDGGSLDLTQLHVAANSYQETDERALNSILKNGQRCEVSGFVIPPNSNRGCCVIN